MWCYQKPGFEALLLTELQRQQQGSQFCDTLLQAEGVSVPAHSCVLSAISPHLSSALSSKPAVPAEQGHLLEFRTLGARALLHMVRLIYSGEMAGMGENERQEAISAAARLGIHGLVEVTKRKSRGGDELGHCAEVGVQTEPLRMEENEARQSRWRREIRDGSTFFWKETLSNSEKDAWTQTEELHTKTASPVQQVATYETLDMDAFQGLGHEFVPITLVDPTDENQTIQHFSAASACVNEPTAAESTSVLAPPCKSVPSSHPHFSSLTTSGAADPQSCWACPQRAGSSIAAAEELEDECFEQFQGNIPGFISYFLNPGNKEANRRGRARRRQRAGVGGARRAGTGEQRAKGSARRSRGRGGFTEKVDVQEVGVGKLQKLFLHKWSMRTLRTGQGGGAVGRMFFLKTRDFLKPTRGYQRRRGHGKRWEFSQNGDALLCSERRGKNAGRGQMDKVQQVNKPGRPVGRTQTSRDESTPLSIFASHKQFHNVHTLSASSPSLQTSLSHSLLSPATSYMSPVMSQRHTTPLPPSAMPLPEDQPEQIDRLLEEVMMGLDILPSNNNRLAQSQFSLPASSSTVSSSSSTSVHNKQQGHIHGTEVPALQQQREGELTEMLENFFQSFEQHMDSWRAREENKSGDVSSLEACMSYTDQIKHKRAEIQTSVPPTSIHQESDIPHRVSSSQTSEVDSDHTGTSQSRSQPHKALACCEVSSEHTAGKKQGKEAKSTRRRKNKRNHLLSLEKRKWKVKKPGASGDTKTKTVHDKTQKQLQQIPLVKLERRGLTQQGQSLEHKSSSETKTSSSLVKYSGDDTSGKKEPAACSRKTYPIRSRFRLAPAADSGAFLEESFLLKEPSSATGSRQGERRKNGQLLRPSDSESSAALVQPQSADSCSTYDQLERHEEDSGAQPQEESEAATGSGEKRRAEFDEDTSDDAIVSKKICLEQMTQINCKTFATSAESADLISAAATKEQEHLLDVETVSLTSVKGFVQGAEQNEKSAQTKHKLTETQQILINEEMESGADEMINVEGGQQDCETLGNKDAQKDNCQSTTEPMLLEISDVQRHVSPSHPVKELSLEWTEKCEGEDNEDINVDGGASPAPETVIINWTESSGGEEDEEDEEVDVVGETTDCFSSVIFTAASHVGVTRLLSR